MLRASRQVLKAGGMAAFLTIEPTPGLTPSERRRAHRVGPEAVAVATSYPSLLRSAGFADVGVRNCTVEYHRTQLAWIDAVQRHADGLRAAMGEATYEERFEQRERTLAATEAGLLARFLYWGTRR